MQNGGSTVLPLLRTIRWLASDSSPSGLFLRRLRELSPLLENISFDHPGPSVVQALLHFPRLHQVRIFRISQPEPFEAIITKPNLTFFRVHEVIGPWADPGRAVSVRDLRVLVVAGAAPALSGLFRLVRFQALKRANIHVMCFSQIHLETTDIMTLLGLFYNAVSTSSLQSIDLALLGSPPPSLDLAFPALRDLLAPILPLSDLRSFNLIGMLTVTSLDDADFEALARAWPKLERLLLHHGFNRECGVSIGALHDLSRRCPDLRELSVPGLRYPIIGVHDIPTPPHRSPSPYISDETAEALARYLLDLFPSLDGWEYKPAPPREKPPREPSPEPPGRRTFNPSAYLSGDSRWWKIARNIYAIYSAREEL
ncbi:hypothetical protein LXA43DRAFT_975931 [Ganoderma leucocontextum]|nr:hypothetical protein LXA43DRAFT_975931 [Ganoderma leucocontextum]